MLKNLCRLCCDNEGIIDLFNTTEDLTPIVKLYYFCNKSKVCIEKDDEFSQVICSECDDQISLCYNFILKCEASAQKLLSLHVKDGSVDNGEEYIKHEYDEFSEEGNIFSGDIETNGTTALEHKLNNKIKQSQKEGYVCTVCSKSFRNETTFSRHMTQHTNTHFRCDICNKNYKSITRLTHHQNKYHKDTDFKDVEKSEDAITIKTNVDEDLKLHSSEHPFQCSVCNKSYKNLNKLKRHQASHAETKTFICDSCGKGFASKYGLNTHMNIHTGETPYSCTYCTAKFTQISSLTIHTRRHHTGEKPYQCTQCNKGFVSKYELKAHYLTHTSEKKFHCVICNNNFKSKSVLRKHVELHSNKHKFICDYCGKECNFKNNLATHIYNKHSSKSGFCSICQKNEPNIESHIMGKHQGYRPLKCSYCPSTFTDKRGLNYHVNFKHIKTGRYKCSKEGCDASFPSKPMLDYHNNKVHSSITPFACDYCSRSFYRKSDLARHNLGTHKQKLDIGNTYTNNSFLSNQFN